MFIDLYKCSVMADALEMKQAYTSITKKNVQCFDLLKGRAVFC